MLILFLLMEYEFVARVKMYLWIFGFCKHLALSESEPDSQKLILASTIWFPLPPFLQSSCLKCSISLSHFSSFLESMPLPHVWHVLTFVYRIQSRKWPFCSTSLNFQIKWYDVSTQKQIWYIFEILTCFPAAYKKVTYYFLTVTLLFVKWHLWLGLDSDIWY